MPDFRHLPDERIIELHDVALNCDLMAPDTQAGLLVGIDRACVASIPRVPQPADALLVTLFHFNGIERLEDGSVPLKQWLQRAHHLRHILPVAALFKRCIEELSSRPALAPKVASGKGVVPKDSRLSEELSALHERRASALARGVDDTPVLTAIRTFRHQDGKGVALRRGDILGEGRYQLLGVLGKGGYGTVWEAWDYARKRYVAIKVLHDHLLQDRSRVERFLRGAEKMSQLDHPHIVKVLLKKGEEQRADGTRYLFYVMELLKGGDLETRVQASSLGEQEVLRIALEVCDALSCAHQEGLLHRVVSPDNILLDEAGVAHLSDFDSVRDDDSTVATHGGGILGKYGFAAPEVLEGKHRPDARADVYSLGMTLLFVLNGGALPPSGVSREEVVLRLRCSPPLREAILQATRDTPRARHADMRAFRAALARTWNASPLLELGARWRLVVRRHGYGLPSIAVLFLLMLLLPSLVLCGLVVSHGLGSVPTTPTPVDGSSSLVETAAPPEEQGTNAPPWPSGPPPARWHDGGVGTSARSPSGVAVPRADAPSPGATEIAVEVMLGVHERATAFFVSNAGHLVTADSVATHMIAGVGWVPLQLGETGLVEAKVIDVDRKAGLALLKADIRPGSVATWAPAVFRERVSVQGLWLDEDVDGETWVLGTTMGFVGVPLDPSGPLFFDEHDMFMLDGGPHGPGHRGAPVLNSRGAVVGMLDLENGWHGTEMRCIPAATIQAYVDRVLERHSPTAPPDAGP